LALEHRGVTVTVLERDPDPPAGIAPTDSMQWVRRGVAQAVHPHFFMGRLRLLLKERYPELAEELLAAGAGEGKFEDYIHPVARATHRATDEDVRLRSINCRRPTFEMIVRRHVARAPQVRIVGSSRVRELIFARERSDDPLHLRGVEC